jgi:hypothetical protein
MKKLLAIMVLGLLWSGNSYAEQKYSLFGVVLGDDVNKYNPKEGFLKNNQLLIDVPNPNNNFISYYASINKKTNKIITVGGIHKKNYILGNQNQEREALIQNTLNNSRKCRIQNMDLVELIIDGPQFKKFNNTFKNRSVDQFQFYIYDGNKKDNNRVSGDEIKFSVMINCINKLGTIVKGEKIGARAVIELIDFRTIRQAIKDNKKFNIDQLDKSGLQTLSRCKGDNVFDWTDCIGAYVISDGDTKAIKFNKDDINKIKNPSFDEIHNASYGTKYIGEFKNGSANGKGVMIKRTGSKEIFNFFIYDGQFKNGRFDGKGSELTGTHKIKRF